METLAPVRVKPSRVKRMKELQVIEKEARQIYAEFEDHVRARRRLARKARKLANRVRRRYPDMRLVGDEVGLHEIVGALATSLHLTNMNNEYNPDEPAHRASTSFEELFQFLKTLANVPWLRGSEE